MFNVKIWFISLSYVFIYFSNVAIIHFDLSSHAICGYLHQLTNLNLYCT